VIFPYIIQYILTLDIPTAGVIFGGVNQEIIQTFPPQTTITLVTDPGDDYAQIIFFGALGTAMVPNAFYVILEQAGARQMEAFLGSYMLGQDLTWLIVITRAQPTRTMITNVTNLNQYYEGYTAFVRIVDKKTFDIVKEALLRLGTSAKLEQAAVQSKALLDTMVAAELETGQLQPRAPIGGRV